VAYRLHWSSPFYGLGPVARSAIPVLLLLAVARDVAGWQTWALIGLIPAAIGAVVRYLTLTYRFERDELVIAEGLLSRRVRHVPYVRIQHVELTQGPLQRLLGVANAIVHSGGGAEEPEAALKVLSVARAEALRAHVSRGRADQASPAGEDVVLCLTPRDLVLCGLTEGRGWIVVGGLIGVLWQVTELLDYELPFRTWLSNENVRRGLRSTWWSFPSVMNAVLGIVAVVVLFRLLSIGWAAVKLHGFTLTRDGDLLRSRYGLVTRFTTAIPRHRVQMLTVVETLLMRLARRAAVKVETAARFAAEENRVGAQWLAPVIARERVAALAADVLPGVSLDALSWRPVDPRASRRLLRGGLVVAAVASAGAVTAAGWWGLIALPATVGFAVLAARRVAQGYAYAVTPEAVAFRSGWWTRRLSVVRMARIQVIALSETFLDRRWQMATLSVDTAGASEGGHPVEIAYLSRAEAARLLEQLREAAARTDLVW
jgi:putative membrane protein